ncbi:MAG TPA: Holliday junction resolvase RuvX [Bacilli bacterium]|nr:Holliday junction resolvase RuvX [Bacilli bacterium]
MSKIIGLDLGTTTVGIAITDEQQKFVFGREVYRFKARNYYAARTYIIELCRKEQVDLIVLGLPYNMDGSLGERGESVKRFASDLQKVEPNLMIEFQDERLSSVEAHERLLATGLKTIKHRETVDMVAAQVILETYLNKRSTQ